MDQKIFAIGCPIIWKKFKFHVQVRPQRGEQKYPSKTGRPVTMKNLCLSICPVLCLDSRYCISNSATVLLACPFLQLLSVYVVEICAVLYPLLAIVDWLHISPAYNKKQTVSGSGHNKSNKSNTFVNQTNPKLWKLKVNEHTRSSSCHCQLTLAGALREPARPCQLGSVFGRPQRPGPGLAQAWHLPMPGLSAMVTDAWQTVTLAHGWLGMISWPGWGSAAHFRDCSIETMTKNLPSPGHVLVRQVYNPAIRNICGNFVLSQLHEFVSKCWSALQIRIFKPFFVLLFSVDPILFFCAAARSASRDIDWQVTAWKIVVPFSIFRLP